MMASNDRRSRSSVSRRELMRAMALGGLAAPMVAGAARAKAAPAAQARAGGTVTLVTAQDFPGLDPVSTTLYNADNLHSLLWNGLTRYDEMMDVQPDLAERWEAVDPRTFVFYLRKGVLFHNGREVVAEDVKFSIERVLDPETQSPYRSYVEGIDSIDLVDDYTVKINLAKPNVVLPASLQIVKIMPKEAAADVVTNPIGTGPYRFVEFAPGDHIMLERFEGYWDQPKPHPERFVIQIVKDVVSAYNGFKAGQFDILWQLAFADVEEAQSNADITVVTPKVSGNSLLLQVDCSEPPFDNKLARQALLYATDKQSIFDLSFFGIGWLSPTNSNLVENHWAFNPNLERRDYNVQRATELFREAGVAEGATLKFNSIAGRQDIQTEAEILERSLQECGITLEINAVDLAQWLALIAPGNHFPGWITFQGNERAWDPAFQLRGFTCNEPEANIWYCNPELDALMEQGVATLDVEARTGIYHQVQEILWEEVPWVTTHHYVFNHAAWNHIQGLYVDGRGMLHFENVSTEK